MPKPAIALDCPPRHPHAWLVCLLASQVVVFALWWRYGWQFGLPLLVATHLRREAALAHRLISMQDGRITADLRRGSAAFDAALKALRPD